MDYYSLELDFMSNLPMFLADIALLLRMLAVYPYRTTPRRQFFSIFAPALIFKLLRAASWIVFVWQSGLIGTAEGVLLVHGQLLVAVYVLIVVDNVFSVITAMRKGKTAYHSVRYMSAVFLWRLRRSVHFGKSNPSVQYSGPGKMLVSPMD
jgi:hypothetical protein